METMEFDQAELDRQLGLSTDLSPSGADADAIQLSESDRATLRQVADKPATGVDIPAQKAAPAVPEYLAPHIPAPVEKSAPAPTDWNGEWEKQFGQAPESDASIGQDSFEAELIRRNSYQQYMSQVERLDYLEGAEAGKVPALELVQNAVRADLQRNGLRSATHFDNEMAQYVDEEGNLTEEGEKRAGEEKTKIGNYLTTVRTEADKHAEQAAGGITEFYQTLDETAKSFKPMGLNLTEEDVADMIADIRSDRTTEWLEKHSSTAEAAEKALWLAIVSSPKRRAELFRLADERGQTYGANKRLASRIN